MNGSRYLAVPARRWLRLAALVVGLAGAGPSSAYENDVHYGLTKWLALKAGFADAEAEAIAAGDRDVDGGALDAIRLVALSACVAKDVTGSELVLEHHFPSAALMPTAPPNREVKPGSKSAGVMATDRLLNPRWDSPARNLRGFGKGLHALQDSFSHMGIPDIPRLGFVSCDPDYAWGHPKALGGWKSHNADLTPKRPEVALKMAAASYEFLCRYRKEVLNAPCESSWDKLGAAVAEFTTARSKAEKWRWFQADAATRDQFTCDFLMEINLKDGGDFGCNALADKEAISARALKAPGIDAGLVAAQKSESPRRIVEATLVSWFVKRDIATLATLAVDPRPFAKSYGLLAKSDEEVRGAAAGLFALWLHRDHGSVVEQLEATGEELLRVPMIKSLSGVRGFKSPQLPDTARLVNYKRLGEALYPVDVDAQLFHVTTTRCNGADSCALAAVRLRKAPYAILLIAFRRVEGLWKIEGWAPLVDH
jgi:hypothetical protein